MGLGCGLEGGVVADSKVITEEHKFMLLKPIEMEKVEVDVKQMVNDKGILVIFLKLLM